MELKSDYRSILGYLDVALEEVRRNSGNDNAYDDRDYDDRSAHDNHSFPIDAMRDHITNLLEGGNVESDEQIAPVLASSFYDVEGIEVTEDCDHGHCVGLQINHGGGPIMFYLYTEQEFEATNLAARIGKVVKEIQIVDYV